MNGSKAIAACHRYPCTKRFVRDVSDARVVRGPAVVECGGQRDPSDVSLITFGDDGASDTGAGQFLALSTPCSSLVVAGL